MATISKLSRDNILRAIRDIDKISYPERSEPTKYHLLYEGKTYPPKIVISRAFKFQYGRDLLVSEFSGGEKRANHILRTRGFDVRPKEEGQKSESTKWLYVATIENWSRCLKNGICAANDDYKSMMMHVRAGDLVLVYVIKMKLAGIFKVTQGYFYDETRIWDDDIHPHRIRIEPIKVPKDLIDITN